MNKSFLLFTLFSMMVACGGSPAGQTTDAANPCATKGATYLMQPTELPGGTCGALPSGIVNIGADGTVVGSITCARITQDGCTLCQVL